MRGFAGKEASVIKIERAPTIRPPFAKKQEREGISPALS